MAERDDRIGGIADPAAQRNCLQALDGALLALVAVRTRVMNQIQDDFTGLRSSAQLFREIFYGVPLPVESPQALIKAAGGPLRIIRVSYKETGMKMFALVDVIAAIPKFKTVFPIKRFSKLGDQLEHIREDDKDAEATWFVNRISTRNLKAALENEAQLLTVGQKRFSPLTSVQTTMASCRCCGETQAPASFIEAAFSQYSCETGATRWSGKEPPRPKQPPGKSVATKGGR